MKVEHGGARPWLLDLSVNLNPLGTPDAVRQAIASASVSRYSDLDPARAVARLAADDELDPAQVLVTAGATEALRLVFAALVRPGDTVVAMTPSYGEYARLAELAGASFVAVPASPPAFEPPIAALEDAIRDHAPALAIVADPNNPTGVGWTESDATGLSETGATVVVDESFLPFAAPATRFPHTPNVIRVRSLTKVLAIPGVRVGYAVADEATIDAMRAQQDPWSVGSHGIAAAAAGGFWLEDLGRSKIAALREGLVARLAEAGVDAVPSSANFVLVDATRSPTLIDRLEGRGIAVRSGASFRLPDYVRIAVPRAEELRGVGHAIIAATPLTR
jgi:threonine-phosphate decarboxylase